MTKQAVVIGGTGSLGSAVQKHFEENNWDVVITGSRNRGDIDNYLCCDLTSKSSIEGFSNRLPREIDTLVIVSGKEPQQSIYELEWEHFNQMIDIHFRGVMWLIKYTIDKMKVGSSIILTSSVAARKGSYDPSYSALKGAVDSLTRSLAKQLSPKIRVNAIAPSLIKDSPVYHKMTEDFRQKHKEASLTGKLLSGEEVAKAIFFINSSEHINGQILHINGGQYFA